MQVKVTSNPSKGYFELK